MGVNPLPLSAPEPLGIHHLTDQFSCGDDSVDNWLRQRAQGARESGSARTFVVCQGQVVVAYYCLSNASFERKDLSSASQRKGVPQQVPSILLGQLGVDQRFAGMGLGRALLRDAMARVLNVSAMSGVVVMHLHASSQRAVDYYLGLGLGFIVSRSEPQTLYLPVQTIRAAFLRANRDQ